MKKLKFYTDKELNERIIDPKVSKKFLEIVVKELFRREFWREWGEKILYGEKTKGK